MGFRFTFRFGSTPWKKDSVGAVKAGERLSRQVNLKIKYNVSVAEWFCNKGKDVLKTMHIHSCNL